MKEGGSSSIFRLDILPTCTYDLNTASRVNVQYEPEVRVHDYQTSRENGITTGG
jgi:hypothetical protein